MFLVGNKADSKWVKELNYCLLKLYIEKKGKVVPENNAGILV